MPTLAIGAAKADRSILTKAFNPGSLGIAVAALAGVALATTRRAARAGGDPFDTPRTASPTWRTSHDLDLPHGARRRLRSAPPEDAVALRVLVASTRPARSAPASWTRSGAGRGGRCRSCCSAPPGGCCSRAAAGTCRSRSPTTPTSTASAGRPSRGRAGSSSPAATRAFDATMIHSKERDTIVDYLGTHQHLAVDIDCSVDDDGRHVHPQRRAALLRRPGRLPLPAALLGRRQRPRVVGRRRRALPHRGPRRQPLLGPLFGYRGSFTVEERLALPPPSRPTSYPFARRTGSSRR